MAHIKDPLAQRAPLEIRNTLSLVSFVLVQDSGSATISHGNQKNKMFFYNIV